jgi:hypothetical protein
MEWLHDGRSFSKGASQRELLKGRFSNGGSQMEVLIWLMH